MFWIGILLLQLVLIYFTSQKTLQSLFAFITKYVRSAGLASWIVGIVYFPGTLLHELSHFLVAVALMLDVREFNLIPHSTKTEHGYYLKLGHVSFYHKDYLRTMMVGVAPIFAGIAFFFIYFSYFHFLSSELMYQALSVYLAFAISSSMFSSKKDMEGTLILIPIAILVISFLFGFKVDIVGLLNSQSVVNFFKEISLYLAPATGINVGLYVVLSFLRKR